MSASTSGSAIFSRRRVLSAVVVATLVMVAAAAIARRQLEPRVHQAVVSRLQTSLESTVELGATHLSFFPLQFRAESLSLRHHGRADVPPLLVIRTLVADLNWRDVVSQVIDRIPVEACPSGLPIS